MFFSKNEKYAHKKTILSPNSFSFQNFLLQMLVNVKIVDVEAWLPGGQIKNRLIENLHFYTWDK